MRIVIFDFNIEGHHFTYVNLISQALHDNGHDIVVMSPCYDLNKYVLNSKDRTLIVPIRSIPPLPKKWNFFTTRRYVINLWKYTANELNGINLDIQKDIVFFPSIDEYISAYIPLFIIEKYFKYRWTGLYVKSRYIRTKQSFASLRKGILNINYLLNLNNSKNIAVLDPGIINELTNRYSSKKFTFLPDIISEASPDTLFNEYQEIINLAAGRKIILLIGAIDKRKGLLNLLNSCKLLDEKKYFFLIAGKIHYNTFSTKEQSDLKTLKKDVRNSFFYEQKIATESHFNALIALSDIVFAAYIDFPYSSNMIGKATFFNKPIIVSRGYLMQEIVEKYNLGIAVSQNNIIEIASAIESLLISNDQRFFKKYLEDNSWSNFCININNMFDDYK
jgi:glycosyltransferase involved in cell wall biosynthesis